MKNQKNGRLRRLRIKKSDDLKAIYAKARRAFTAAELQRFTEIDDSVSADEVLARLESMARVTSK